MAENTIFQNQPVENQPTNSNQLSASADVQNSAGSAYAPQDIGVVDISSGKKQNFSLKNILKFFVGIIVLALVVFLIIRFIIPLFAGKKTENVTLVYWGLWEDKSTMQSIISEFEKENPTIKIDYVKQDIKQYRERLTTRINNNTGPDIFRYHNTWYPMFSKLLLPLPSDVISAEDFKKNYYFVLQKDLIKNGAIYGIPLGIDTLALYVNSDLLSALGVNNPPGDWEEFAALARRLTVKDESGKIKTAGAAMGSYSNISHAPDIISLLFLQNGVNINNITSTKTAAADALQFYTAFAKGEGSVWDNTLDNSILAFAKENLAMCFGYSWDAFTIKALNPNLNFKTYLVPQLPGETINMASYWVEGISSKSKYHREALLFMKFLAKKETTQKLFTEQSKTRQFGEPYARIDLADSLKTNEQVYPFVEQAKTANSSLLVDSTYDNGLNDKASKYLETAVNSILNEVSPETAVETLVKGLDQIINQYGQ